MAKRKQRTSAGKKAASKRGTAGAKAKATRKKVSQVAKAKTTTKKAPGRGGRKVTTKKGSRSIAANTKVRKQLTKARAKRPAPKKTALAPSQPPKQSSEVPEERAIVDMVEEPAPGVVIVTEFEAVRTSRPRIPAPQIGAEEGSGLTEEEED